MRGARGFSLIELTIAIGLIALLAATGAGLTLANRSLAVAAAASEFDQLLDSARTMARELGGGRLSLRRRRRRHDRRPSPPRIRDGTLVPPRYRRCTPMPTSPNKTASEIRPSRWCSTPTAASAASRTPPRAKSAAPRAAAITSASPPPAARQTASSPAGRFSPRAGRSHIRSGHRQPARRPRWLMRRPLHAAAATDRIVTRAHLPERDRPGRNIRAYRCRRQRRSLHRDQSLHLRQPQS